MQNITILTCCTKLLNRRISSVPTEQLQSDEKKLLETESGEAKSMRTCKCSKNTHGISNKGRKNQILVNIPRLPQASGNRMIQNVPMSLMSEFESLQTTEESAIRSTKKFYITTLHVEKTHVNVQRTHKAQESERYKTIRIDWCERRKLVQSWMLELLQFLMFQELKCMHHHWVLRKSPYGFWLVVVVMKVCERHSSSQLWNCALRFIVAQKGGEFRQCEFWIFQTYRGTSLTRFTRFE